MSATPPSIQQQQTAGLIVGSTDLLWWMFIVIGFVDWIWLGINNITLPAETLLKVQFGFDLLIAGFVLRLGLVVYVLVAGKGSTRNLFDISFDAVDAIVFFATFIMSSFAVFMLNVLVPNIIPRLGVIGLFGVMVAAQYIKEDAPPALQKIRKLFRRIPKHAFMAIIFSQVIFIKPLAVSLSVAPTSQKMFGILMAISEETFFHAALLPMFIIILSLFLPLGLAMIGGVAAAETLFAYTHAFVYGNDPTTIWIVFFSGVVLAGAYLSGPVLGKPARPSGNSASHTGINYLVS